VSLSFFKLYNFFQNQKVARIDFLYSNNKLYLCEINTIPGTLAFYLWSQGFEQLLNEMITIALDKD
jgi:D-alanine-D-alanine ligase